MSVRRHGNLLDEAETRHRSFFSRAPRIWLLTAALLPACTAPATASVVVTWEAFGLPAESFHNGHLDGPNTSTAGSMAIGTHDSAFTDQGAAFSNQLTVWDDGFISWNGWALSSVTNTTTAGFTNQYAAIPGQGTLGSATYAVASDTGLEPAAPKIHFTAPSLVSGAYLTNSVYAYLAIEEGDTGGFFNPDPFDTGDFLLLTIIGRDAQGNATGMLEYYLSDYRSANPAEHYTVSDWEWLDMTSLGTVSSLHFALSGSDVDPVFGLNTPAHFALDQLTFSAAIVPEPDAWLMMMVVALAALLLGGRRCVKCR